MKKIIDRKKGEKGAITLFVLLACLFFVFTLAGVYISNLNKQQTQEQQLRQIQENYAKNIDRIDEIYESLSKGIKINLSQNPEAETWAREVTLTGTAEVKENYEATIKGYAFTKDGDEEITWESVTDEKKIEKALKVTENGEYIFWVKDSKGEIYKSNKITVENIDRTAPTAGAIIAKEENQNGKEYELSKSLWTDKNIYIEKVDGSDPEPGSGHKQTTIIIQKNGIIVEEWKNIEGPVTLEETGEYTITVTTEDNVGNKVTSTSYTVKIDKVVPTLALKHNDETGATYDGTWTKDDLYGEITIDTTETGKTVEKYQYSENGIVWDDISAKPVMKELNYTTTFPMTDDKPEWITEPINNGTYYFEVQEDGTLKSNNNGKGSSTANSNFEIDLTDYPDASLTITINAEISSESSWDKGLVTIKGENDTSEQTIINNISGIVSATDYSITITGGQKYTLNLKYSKDGSVDGNLDTFTINSITLQSDALTKGINFKEYTKTDNKVTFKLQEEIEKEIYIRAVYTGENDYSKSGDETSIKIDRKAPSVENSETIVMSQTEAKANINVIENDSGLKGYYVSTDETAPTETSPWTEQILKEFTIEGLNTNTTYYLWLIDDAGNISEKYEMVVGKANYVIDDNKYVGTLKQAIEKATDGSTIKLLNDYTDTSTATIDKNVTLDIQGYTLTRDKKITVNSSKTMILTGAGILTTETTNVNTITNNGTLTINGSITIENMSTSSSYAPIYSNNGSAKTNINDNVNINGYYRGIYNYNGTINVNGGLIKSTYSSSSAYGIYNNNSNSKVYINNGVIEGYTGVYNSSTNSLTEMTGGKIIGTGSYGISGGTVNVYGGRIEGKTYGIYGTATNKVTIGKEEETLSERNPAIYGASYGIYMSNETYSFNFYNGVIISNTENTAYKGALNPRTNYMTYTYLDYEVEQKYCTILTPTVENITMEATPTEYTNGDVTVKITYPYIEGNTKQYSEDGTTWNDASQYAQKIFVAENKTIYARTLNEAGVITDENQIEITNIDKEKPSVTISPSQTNYSVTSSNGTADITLTITATDTGVSGLDKMQYAWVAEGEEPTYIDFTNTVTINKTKVAIGQYNLYLNITDKAGNVSDIKRLRYNVKFEEPVCQIGSTTYITIQSAIDACSKEAGETQTTIEMLKSTDEEFSTYSGQNIILDLKGYTIGSSNLDIPLCTNIGTLQLIDTSTEKTGKLESLNGTAVLNNGTFTMGDNSTSIEMEVPTIYGQKIGINNQETFNFYDGKTQGITPIQGKVTDTPEEYGPVTTNYENGITTMQLGIVTGYEARIEWVYYTTVQEAIDATKLYKNNYRDTVTIIKDIQLKEIAEVNASKNMILDLYGYELTIISEKDGVINNYGKLEITDSSIEQTGEISIESTRTCYGIYNNGTGTVEVSGGTVSSSNSSSGYSSYGIYNRSTGTVKISGGTASSSSGYSSYGIYNASTGTIEISEGTVSSSSGYSSYGIYNESTGTVKVSGGTVSSSSSSNSSSYGICNIDNGTVEVSGGTVSGNSHGIDNRSAGIVEVSGGTISSTVNNRNIVSTNYGIENRSTGTVKVSGGTVSSSSTSSSYGIYNWGTGTVEVSGGTVSSNSSSGNRDSYGIYNKSTGSIIIGTKEDGVISQENPNIKGKYTGTVTYFKGYGVYNMLGNVEFYNGIIQGDIALSGNITKIRERYKIEKNTIDEKESIYLVEKTETEYIVQIEDTKYYSLQEAIDSMGEEEKTIKVIKDFELEEKETIKFNKNVILNLNGYTITNNYYRIENTGNLTIEDLTDNKEGKIENVETLIGVLNIGEGNIMMKGGTVSSGIYGIYNESTGTVEVRGGTVSSGSYGIYNESTGTVKVSEGTVSSGSYGIYNESTGTVEVRGGTVSGGSYGIYNESTGTVKVSEGTVSSSSSNNGYSYGIYNKSTGTVEVSGGTVSGSSSYRSYGIYNASTGTIEISEGTVSSSCSNSGNSYGIYNIRTGSIIIGTEGDGIVSQEEPYIKGEYAGTSTSYAGYGIYNTNGKLYLYDGKIEGTTKAVYDTITEKEDNTELNYNEDETILTLAAEVAPVAQIGETTYTSLQEAINTVGSSQTTITLLRNVAYTINDTAITIPSTKNIILNLNGYKITSAIPEKVMQNEGILEIIDTSETQTGSIVTSEEKTINNISGAKLTISGGKIENRTKYAIYTEGELTIQGGTVSSSSGSNSYGIYNGDTGTVEVSGGAVSSSSSSGVSSYGIYNESTGTITVSGGTVSSSSYGIYNESTGTITVSRGTVSSSSYGIYNKSTGSIIIGTKGDEVISQKEPKIIAKYTGTLTNYTSYGIYNPNGTLKYYDGIIKGTTKAIYGNIEEIEDLTELVVTTETIDSTEYETLKLQETTTNVASVNNVEYDSIQKAVKACGTTENTIKILRNSNPGATVTIEEGQNITIDLNGYTTNTYQEITNKATLKITDTSTEQTGKIVGLAGIAITNTGTMELLSGSISDSGYGIKNTGTLDITGGNIQNNSYGIYNDGSGIINITAGNINSNTYGIYNYSSSTTSNITGGTITSNEYGIYNSHGTTNITSIGLTSNTYGIYVAGGTVDLNSGIITGGTYGSYVAGGTVNLNSGAITGGTYGIYNSGGTTNIKEGAEITSNTGGCVERGTLNIGETGTMNSSSPVITGETYGLSVASTGTVYMYDGQIKGKTGATQGYITYTESGYQVANKVEGEYFVDYLALAGTVSTVAQVNGIDFSNLQSAINSVVGEEAQTIKLTNGIITTVTFSVAEGQNIILDMNGKTISSDLEITIENAGSLTIIDSTTSGVAKISSTVGTAIKNTGTLTLGENDGTVNQELITIDGTTYGIENSGTLNFYDGTINGASAVNGTITSRATGYIIRTTTVNGKERYYLST